jgi:hypothetical protein
MYDKNMFIGPKGHDRYSNQCVDPLAKNSLISVLFLILCIRCVAFGVLPEDEAEKLYKKVLKRKKGGYAVSSSTAVSSKNSPAKKKKKPKVIKEEDADPDMQLSGAQEVGRAVL